MQIGAHVSISGSVANAVSNAIQRKCNAFQIFTRSPRSWFAKELDPIEIKEFKDRLSTSKIDRFATTVHMPYLPNLSSPDKEGYDKSIKTMIKEVERCNALGIPYLVTHLGSHRGTGEEKGIERLVNALNKVAETDAAVTILLENTAGQKNSVGSDFKQWSEIFSKCKNKKRFGVCFDTCHAFAAGYDLRTRTSVKKTLKDFDNTIGFENLKILHLNDSKGMLNENRDRHEHIGLGQIGDEGMTEIIQTMNKKKIPMILETPIDDKRDDFGNIEKVKSLA
ncbi:deoxyribonuclease IV [Candidatus Nitrosopelagicus sp.]|nr:deoxyribonuclease IV [Candidatus Nitrosopelagicus sp.]|tara:strand:+ start:972 stop:1811 length:840 start_codon:yes stop_codon:yes gene_type:complete